jgi:RNA polymerase sigma factor (sigma-70 family)
MRFIAAQGSTCLWSGVDRCLSSQTAGSDSLFATRAGGEQVRKYMSADDLAAPEEFARRVRLTLMRGDEGCEELIDWGWANRRKFERIAKAYRLDNQADREDVFQSFVGIQLVKVWKAFWNEERTGDVVQGFHDYLIQSYINAVRKVRRRVWAEQKRFPRPLHVVDSAADDVAEAEAVGVEGAGRLNVLAAKDTAAAEADGQDLEDVLQFLNDLTPAERDVCKLLFVERLPVDEVAKRLGKSQSCVYAHKSHAKQKLGWFANQYFYHVTTDDVVDVAGFVKRLESDSGFLGRVRDALLENCPVATAAALNGEAALSVVATIVDGINAHVLDVPHFCRPEELAVVFGEIAADKFEELPPWQHVRITRLVLDYFLRGTMLPARNKVIL